MTTPESVVNPSDNNSLDNQDTSIPDVKGKWALPFLECIDFVGELSGVDEASKDVVGEVAESKRDSAEVF